MTNENVSPHPTAQRLCVWSGPVLMVTFLAGFLIMGFLPPPDPNLTGDQVLELFTAHQGRIRLGGALLIVGVTFIFPWVSVVSVQLKRIEGRFAPLAYTQLTSGALGAVLFLAPIVMLEAIAYQPQRLSPEVAQGMYYFSFLFFVGTPLFAVVQNVAIAGAIFGDRRSHPVFPRWVGYFNVWSAILFVPGILVYFFTSGPFAWRGLFAWWVPLSVFGIWFIVMVVTMLRVIDSQAHPSTGDREPAEGTSTLQPT